MTSALLQLQNISCHFGEVAAVNGVSLTVEQGEFITLLGSSGCGKTTMLRLIAGFEKLSNGAIRLNGKQIATPQQSMPPKDRRIGMVFQDYALFPHLSVSQNVAFGVEGSRSQKEARTVEMLKLVGMTGYGDRMAYQLSGGQQQRVALARALAPSPEMLLLDEPFSNLDATLRAQVRSEVRSILRQTGTTCIFVTHDQEEALSLSDRIAVIFEGRLQQVGTPEQLYNQPISARVAAFIGEANFIQAEASGSRATSPLGELTLMKPARGAVQVLVRPERVHLDTKGEGVMGEVLWREYYGSRQRIAVKLPDATTLIASTDTQVSVDDGDRVKVSVFGPLLAF